MKIIRTDTKKKRKRELIRGEGRGGGRKYPVRQEGA